MPYNPQQSIALFAKLADQVAQYRQAAFNRQLTIGALDYERKGGDPVEYVQTKLAEKAQAESGSFLNRLRAPNVARPSSQIEQRLVADTQYENQVEARTKGAIELSENRATGDLKRLNQLRDHFKQKMDLDLRQGYMQKPGRNFEKIKEEAREAFETSGFGTTQFKQFLMPYFKADVKKMRSGKDQGTNGELIRKRYPELSTEWSKYGIKTYTQARGGEEGEQAEIDRALEDNRKKRKNR